MASLVLSGDTSGSITVAAPAVSGSNTQTLAAVTGTLAPVVSGTVNAGGTAPFPSSGGPTNVDFTDIPSWVKRITVTFSGVSTNGASPIKLRLGTSGGVETTGYLGYNVLLGSTSISGAANFVSGFDLPFAASSSIIGGSYVFSLVDLSSNAWVGQGMFGRSDAVIGGISAGSKALSGVLNQIKITTNNGTDTFDAGIINILYE